MDDLPFSPCSYLKRLTPDEVAQARLKVAQRDTERLRAICREVFAEPLLSELKFAQLWLVNEELNARGIGPRWRGFGNFNPNAVPKYSENTWPVALGPAPLGDAMCRKLLIRWCDAAWLRRQLGPSHIPRAPSWRPLFLASTTDDVLEALYSRLALGGESNARLTNDLSVPAQHALALRGFVVAGAGDRHATVRRRMRDKIGPGLDALSQRPKYALNADQIARRRVYAEAIELANGSTSDAARFVAWIGGDAVSPQAVDRMRAKIASDVGLTGKKWRPAGG